MIRSFITYNRIKGVRKFWPGVAWLFLILLLLLLPSSDLPKPKDWMDKIHFDKMVHAGLFGVLVFLWLFPVFLSTRTYKAKRNLSIFFIICVSLFGIITELLQSYFSPTRQFDWIDWAADTVGAAIAVYITRWIANWANKHFPRTQQNAIKTHFV